MEERLQKILARAGIASRRHAEEMIRQGVVAVDGKIITELGARFDPQQHTITVGGKPLVAPEELVYYLLNKPKGYVTTAYDPQKRPIVTSLLHNVPQRVFPVGRLDLDTEGALLLTNDGALAQRIIHPRHEVTKTYLAEVRGTPAKNLISQLEKGIEIDGKKTWPAQLKLVRRLKTTTVYEIRIHEGRKRQIKKMFAAIGHPVVNLKRTAYGNLKIGSLKPGQYRLLSQSEVNQIFSGKNYLYNR